MTALTSMDSPPDIRVLHAPMAGGEHDARWIHLLVLGCNLETMSAAAGDLDAKIGVRVATSKPWKSLAFRAECQGVETGVTVEPFDNHLKQNHLNPEFCG